MERRVTTWVAIAVVALVSVVVVVVVVGRGSDEPGPIDGDVVVIGDSVTYMSDAAITEQVGSAGLEILATPGHRSTDLLPVLQAAVDDRGGPDSDGLQKVAFLVGYNDVLDEALEENVLAEMVELSSRFDCAVWLALPGGFGDRTDDLLREEVDRHESVHLDHGWAEAVEADRDLISEDGVHPTEAGTEALAEVYRDALHGWCDPVPLL